MEKSKTLNLRLNPIVKHSAKEIYAQLQEGYDDMKAGKVQDVAAAFAKFRENHSL